MSDDVFNPDDESVIQFTPEPGAKIEQIAPLVIKMTREMEMDAEIHYPNFTLEVPRGAKTQDIVDAYYKVAIDYLPDVRATPKLPPRGPKLG